jgi:hypothetical protein
MREEDLRTNFTPEMLRTILKRRGLPYDGKNTELLASQLAQHNRGIYCKYMDALENSHQPSELRFELFRRLPTEIRECIWELCHEPRVLCANGQRPQLGNPVMFWGYKNPPNPVTLRVCQESRAVALRQYRLMPHHERTSLVYANFSGGDILYFNDPYWIIVRVLQNIRRGPQSHSSSSSTAECHDAAWFDSVERVVLPPDFSPGAAYSGQKHPSINLTRTCIQTFRNLKHLSVEERPSSLLQWSEPSTVQSRQIDSSESDTYQRDVRDTIAKVFADVVEEDGLSTRKPLEISIVTITLLPKAPTKDWMVDLSTPIV